MKVLTKEQVNHWLEGLLEKSNLVAPVVNEGKVLYQEIGDISQIVWEFTRPDMPPRNWVIPMTEPILFIEQGKTTILIEPDAPEETIIFGLRPCDAKSFKVLDALFLETEPVDPQYDRHRKSVTLVGLACPNMWESCFCTIVGGSPNDTEGLDILLTEVEGRYIVQVLTEKGEHITADLPLSEEEIILPDPELNAGFPQLRESSQWADLFKDVFWDDLSRSCLSCRVCSFVCPTCRCYDVRDEVVSIRPGVKKYERLRAWDTCTSTGYRRIAGGHNPRNTQDKRLKNRFYCKFMYYPEDFNILGCVGCGRCIDACPAGIDILDVVSKVNFLLEESTI